DRERGESHHSSHGGGGQSVQYSRARRLLVSDPCGLDLGPHHPGVGGADPAGGSADRRRDLDVGSGNFEKRWGETLGKGVGEETWGDAVPARPPLTLLPHASRQLIVAVTENSGIPASARDTGHPVLVSFASFVNVA